MQSIRISQLHVPSTKFTFIHPPNDTKNVAIYTEINDDSKQRVYLLPQVDNTQIGQRRYVIRAVQTKNQDPEGKYLFSTSVSKFPGLECDTPFFE